MIMEGTDIHSNEGVVTWRSPSNIALVKYWGKKPVQIPANTSISFTLKNAHTTTTVSYIKKPIATKSVDFEFYFEGKKETSFEGKIGKFFERAAEKFPVLNYFSYHIDSSNSFPHSSGIASSASAMSALALCVTEILLANKALKSSFGQTASELARLGSGSACRSIHGPMMLWGKHEFWKNSSDEYAIIPGEISDHFKTYQDVILLVDKSRKTVGSSQGHALMKNHPYAKARFHEANLNCVQLFKALQDGDQKTFQNIVEKEALSLHAMMLTSDPPFMLMKSNSLSILEKIKEKREQSGLQMVYTLDAGANVHLLFPERVKFDVMHFIESELIAYCEKGEYICDMVGLGPEKVIASHA